MERRVDRQCAGRIPLLGAAAFLLIATALVPAAAEYHEIGEIRPFSLTDVDGYVNHDLISS